MTRIAPVYLPYNPRPQWFDAGTFDLHKGDKVVVVTKKGSLVGSVAAPLFDASDDQIAQLSSPLKVVKRPASDADITHQEQNEQKAQEALAYFRQLVAEQNRSDMTPVAVEYFLEGSKAIFYFAADQRVDFRSIVRDLSSHLKVKADMHQIGVREQACMLGGIGHCGQELCCARLGVRKFKPVSIKMAKEQGLSINPQKISGACGRLMCCMRYEFDAYKEFNKRAPKMGAKVDTPDSYGKWP